MRGGCCDVDVVIVSLRWRFDVLRINGDGSGDAEGLELSRRVLAVRGSCGVRARRAAPRVRYGDLSQFAYVVGTSYCDPDE